jgi:hypothetical protein
MNDMMLVVGSLCRLVYAYSSTFDRQWIEITLDGGRHWWNTSLRYSFTLMPPSDESSHEYTWFVVTPYTADPQELIFLLS